MLFVGDDWAEDHHDIEIVDQTGQRLVRRRLPEGAAGIAELHALVADHLDSDAEPDQVVVGIETDRGPWVQALLAAGYRVYAINPLQASRYRERHGVSGAKSDPGDAYVLAEVVRLDRDHHRPVAGDSAIAEHVKVVARAHQSMIWSRQRQTNTLRSMLREYPRHPGRVRRPRRPGCAGRSCAAPTPAAGRRLRVARVAKALRAAGRQRGADTVAARIVATLREDQLEAQPGVVDAYAASVNALVADRRARPPVRGAARAGGRGFWPAPGR